MNTKKGFFGPPKIGKEKWMKLCLLGIFCLCPFLIFIYAKSASQISATFFRREISNQIGPQSRLRNIPGFEKEDFLAEISDFKSSLQKLSNYIDNFLEENEIEEDKESNFLEKIEIQEDEEWNFYEDTFISGCTKTKCEDIPTLVDAKTKCKLSDDCLGITEENKKYQLRAGPGAFSSSSGEKSWLLKIEPCDDELVGENRISIRKLEDSYKELRNQRFKIADEKCLYLGKFSHVNKLLDFDPQLVFSTISFPTSCSFQKSTDSIIFGIKSMPESLDFRNAIRDTWLNNDLWENLGFQIKVVFLIGNPGETDLTEEIKTNDDLLVSDFEENHYNLPFKDLAFLRFIEEKCSAVNFVFKGDDDILLIPQNLINEISRIKSSESIDAIGCKKESNGVQRDPKNKYFIPDQIYREEKWETYFSGAGYLTTGNFSKELAKMAEKTNAVPLDDCWIGILINKMNKSQNMAHSEGICMGVINNIPIDDYCTSRGLTINHKIFDSNKMRSIFAKIIDENHICEEKDRKKSEKLLSMMGKAKKDAWKENFDNFEGTNFKIKNLI